MSTFPLAMGIPAAALAFPASAALAVWAVRGRAVLDGDGRLPFLALVLTGLAGLVGLAVAARAERRRRPVEVTPAVEALLGEVATPLGDVAVAFDEVGRLVWANDAAVALSGYPAEALLGRGRDVLGEDLAVLLRGLYRGPAAGRVGIPTPAGRVPARAAAARVPGERPIDVALVRVTPPEADASAPAEAVDDRDILAEPPPASGAAPAPPGGAEGTAAGAVVERITEGEPCPGGAPGAAAAAPAPGAGLPTARAFPHSATGEDASALAEALAVELGGSLARATASVSMLRLALPRAPAAGGAGEHLGRLEAELRAAESALAALTAPIPAGAPQALDLEALVGEAIAAARFAPGVRVRRVGGGCAVRADPEQLRDALRHLLAAAARAMPSGGELGVRSARRADAVVLEIAHTGAGAETGLDLALAERLVVAQGGGLAREAVPGRGTRCRVTLPGSPAARQAL